MAHRVIGTSMSRGILAGVLAVALMLLLPTSATWAQTGQAGYQQDDEDVRSSRDEVPAGGTVTIIVEGYGENVELQIEVLGAGFEQNFTVTTNAAGRVTFDVQVPCDASEGEVTVSVTGPDGEGATVTKTTTFTVEGRLPSCPVQGSVADTGANISPGVLIAVIALLLGGGLVLATRYARSRSGTSA